MVARLFPALIRQKEEKKERAKSKEKGVPFSTPPSRL
jgi:hypothetical protein